MAKKKAVKKTAIKKGSAAAKAKMAKVRKAKKNYILVEADRQTKVKTTNSGGYLYPYNKTKDEGRKAMPPGKRISKKTDNPYWEYRVNRSDKKGSLTGTISGIKNSIINEWHKNYEKIVELENAINKEKKRLKNSYLDAYDKNIIKRNLRTATQVLNFYRKKSIELKRKL
jgi:hypothetical protein